MLWQPDYQLFAFDTDTSLHSSPPASSFSLHFSMQEESTKKLVCVTLISQSSVCPSKRDKFGEQIGPDQNYIFAECLHWPHTFTYITFLWKTKKNKSKICIHKEDKKPVKVHCKKGTDFSGKKLYNKQNNYLYGNNNSEGHCGVNWEKGSIKH